MCINFGRVCFFDSNSHEWGAHTLSGYWVVRFGLTLIELLFFASRLLSVLLSPPPAASNAHATRPMCVCVGYSPVRECMCAAKDYADKTISAR